MDTTNVNQKTPIVDNNSNPTNQGKIKEKKPHTGGHNGGRPLEWTEEKAMSLMTDMESWYYSKHLDHFTLLDYCTENRVNQQRISDLADRFPAFLDRLKNIKDLLTCRINRLGMVARNPAYPIFLQKNLSGYTDRQDINQVMTINVHHTESLSSAWADRQRLLSGNADPLSLPSDTSHGSN